jgi:RNA polymerase sigma factor (sigma-70 family)
MTIHNIVGNRTGEYGALVEKCERLILSFIGKYGLGRHPIEADDVLQEAKIRLWKALENGNDIRHLSAYIRKIVDSVVLDELKKIRRDESFLRSEGVRGFVETHLEREGSSVPRSGREEKIMAAILTLKRSRRVVLDMTISGFSIREIADINQWTKKKTYALYERGLKDLRNIVSAEGRRP